MERAQDFTPCFVWPLSQMSGTPVEGHQWVGSWQTQCNAGLARKVWHFHTGSGCLQEVRQPGLAGAETNWPSPAEKNTHRWFSFCHYNKEHHFCKSSPVESTLTALRVRSHCETISRIWVMMSLLVLAISTLFSLTSIWHALQCSLASSACQQQSRLLA